MGGEVSRVGGKKMVGRLSKKLSIVGETSLKKKIKGGEREKERKKTTIFGLGGWETYNTVGIFSQDVHHLKEKGPPSSERRWVKKDRRGGESFLAERMVRGAKKTMGSKNGCPRARVARNMLTSRGKKEKGKAKKQLPGGRKGCWAGGGKPNEIERVRSN